jgi:hypothetical protein
MTTFCDDNALSGVIEAMHAGEGDPLPALEALLVRHPEDARLHFLRGSILIGASRLIEAHSELSRAVELAPDYPIARFQLGFFQLTSGEADAALQTWGRLDRLPEGHYLRRFVDGLRALIRDEFAVAIGHLRAGIALNQENPPLNGDMQLLIDQCLTLAASEAESAEASSETALILNQYKRREDH